MHIYSSSVFTSWFYITAWQRYESITWNLFFFKRKMQHFILDFFIHNYLHWSIDLKKKKKKRNRVVAQRRARMPWLIEAIITFASRDLGIETFAMWLNSSFRGSFALNRWLSVVQIASEVFIYRWEAWSLVYLQGICFMLSLIAGENGAIIKNDTRVKITNRIFLSCCFGGSIFQRVHLWMAGMVYEINPSQRGGNNLNTWIEEAWGG